MLPRVLALLRARSLAAALFLPAAASAGEDPPSVPGRAGQDRAFAVLTRAQFWPAGALEDVQSGELYAVADQAGRLSRLAAKFPQANRSAAAEALQRAARDLSEPADLAAVGQLLAKLGEAQAATQLAARLAQADPARPGRAPAPGDAQALMWAAHALRLAGRGPDAERAFAAASAADPGNRQVIAWDKLPERGGGRLPAPQPGSAPALGGPDAPGIDPSLSAADARKVDKALVLLGRTPTGKQVLLAVAADRNGVVDLSSLQRLGRVDVRKGRLRDPKMHAEVQQALSREAVRFTHIVMLDQEALNNPEAVLAPLMGQKLYEVGYWRAVKDKLSKVLSEVGGRVQRMLIWSESGEPDSGENTLLQQDLRFDSAMLNNRVPNVPKTPDAANVYGRDNLDLASNCGWLAPAAKRPVELLLFRMQSDKREELSRESKQPWYLQYQQQLTGNLRRQMPKLYPEAN